jgi:hypothetical protein
MENCAAEEFFVEAMTLLLSPVRQLLANTAREDQEAVTALTVPWVPFAKGALRCHNPALVYQVLH